MTNDTTSAVRELESQVVGLQVEVIGMHEAIRAKDAALRELVDAVTHTEWRVSADVTPLICERLTKAKAAAERALSTPPEAEARLNAGNAHNVQTHTPDGLTPLDAGLEGKS